MLGYGNTLKCIFIEHNENLMYKFNTIVRILFFPK